MRKYFNLPLVGCGTQRVAAKIEVSLHNCCKEITVKYCRVGLLLRKRGPNEQGVKMKKI